MSQDTPFSLYPQVQADRSRLLADACYAFLKPLLVELHRQLDRRLVATFLATVLAILRHRHRNHGLLLTELGAALAGPPQAVAGTKRLKRLLYARTWGADQILAFLGQAADDRVHTLTAQGETPLVIWDESVIEKSESLHLDGLGPVRSTKAARLKRIKPGYYNPPGGPPVFVPGFHWLAVLVLGRRGPPTLATLRFWTTRGPRASSKREEESAVLDELAHRWGHQVLHVWDRGFAGLPWLQLACHYGVRFVLRWPKGYTLVDTVGQRKAWQITRGKRSWDHRQLWDARRRTYRTVGIVAVPVWDPAGQRSLWLVVSRPGRGRPPWYLVTNEPIRSVDEAWRIVLIYARRWQIEMALRFEKSELSYESLRVVSWETRTKLWGLAALAYAFLLSLLPDLWAPLREWLLTTWGPSNDKRSREVSAPLYRLRTALARLWLAYPPPCLVR